MNWIACKDRLPTEDIVDVLIYDLTNGEVAIGQYTPVEESHDGFIWHLNDRYCTPIEVEHWMPLPEKPQ